MKLRILAKLQLVFAIALISGPVLKTITRTGLRISIWFYLFEALCIGGLFICRWLYRCPHCQKQLKPGTQKQCPHCKESLDL